MPLEGGDFALEGGLTQQDTFGQATDWKVQPQWLANGTCGNGIREAFERCDDTDLGGKDCTDLGYAGGTLACSASCTFVADECIAASSSSSVSSSASVPGGDLTNPPSGGTRPVIVQYSSSAHSASARSSKTSSAGSTGVTSSMVATVSSRASTSASAGQSDSSASTDASSTAVASGETHAANGADVPSGTHNAAPGEAGDEQQLTPEEWLAANDMRTTGNRAVAQVESAAIGGASVVELGIFGRLSWIARFRNIYAAIPAYESASAPFSGLFSGMQPGAVSVSALLPPFWLPGRRKRKRIPSSVS